jgi:hypothetical protein
VVSRLWECAAEKDLNSSTPIPSPTLHHKRLMIDGSRTLVDFRMPENFTDGHPPSCHYSATSRPPPQKNRSILHHKRLTMHAARLSPHGLATIYLAAAAAAALARSFWFHSPRKTFISALSVVIRGATPLYFFVIPLTVRLTAP